jgi:hypothetical protein
MERDQIKNTRLYLGPMTKNIVDAIIDYNTNVKNCVGIIASRRQIDYYGGYVNNWTTQNFVKYVQSKNVNIIVCRDHGGPHQGSFDDDGGASFLVDSVYMNIIHIDPFKAFNYGASINYTVKTIEKCSKINDNCLFEIGTEESIQYIDADILYSFINDIKKRMPKLFSKIVYAVIQSGTSLRAGENIGNYDKTRLTSMIKICHHFGLLSKEHNGDYLTSNEIKSKFDLGLSAINIAPEIAHIESEYILQNISGESILKWYELCINDGQWKKWFPPDFNPDYSKYTVLKLCGHYVFTNPDFINIFDLRLASEYVTEQLHNFINERT